MLSKLSSFLRREITIGPMRVVRVRPWSTRVMICNSIIALLIGLNSGAWIVHQRFLNPFGNSGLFIILAAYLLAMFLPVILHMRWRVSNALVAVAIEQGLLCFGFVAGLHLAMDFRITLDSVKACLGFWLLTFFSACVALFVARLVWQPQNSIGPFCLDCGYNLIGLSKRVCPECGRPFSTAELGIAEADLHVPNQQARH